MQAPQAESSELLTLLLDGDRRRAEEYARQIVDRQGVRYLYEEVVGPALQRVGDLWQSNRITIADEHLASATAQSAVAALYPQFRWPPRGPRALIACVEGERHEFGARMVADLLALDGWDERLLGADVPLDEVVHAVDKLRPRMLGLSITLPVHLEAARAVIERLRASFPQLRILVGGRATAAAKVSGKLTGADGIARCGSEAVEVARGWK